ncbi:MAG: PilN domain-containing protein [Pseudomonadales bacterium]|nr:PilN domain-containing protein [Halieaceae bacterium]MCP5163759.1 PilN domain-containing protein [Pseudomonadales bacterium]MCP5190316.1 PilN domain-containing protein [Pseudomonadales bacterium]MCP5203677.1 PilN domain-containing protein [Pseudomonadales bacterium]
MAHINLLPWREERRQELKKDFLVTSGLVLLLAVGLVLLGDRIVNGQIENQKARNQYLVDNIKILDEQVAEIRELEKKRNQLLDRMRVIQELQGNRPIIVRVLDQLVRTVPDGVFYTNLQTNDKTISIRGVAESNNRVSSLMRRLAASDWLANPNLDAVRAAPEFGDQANTFNLTVQIQAPESEKKSGEG